VGKTKNTRIVHRLHNKPTGCGASGAYAPGPDDEEEEEIPHILLVKP
jgi:hypothetical protein